jgi:hypothetical protein
MNAVSTSTSTGRIDVRFEIERIVDTSAARRLAQLLFVGSTGMVVASSTGVAS